MKYDISKLKALDTVRENEQLKKKLNKIRDIVFYDTSKGFKSNIQIVHELMRELS